MLHNGTKIIPFVQLSLNIKFDSKYILSLIMHQTERLPYMSK